MTFDDELIDVPRGKVIRSIRRTVRWKGFREKNEMSPRSSQRPLRRRRLDVKKKREEKKKIKICGAQTRRLHFQII